MKSVLVNVYCNRMLKELIGSIAELQKNVFPRLQIQFAGEWEPNATSYDTAQKHYDAYDILSNAALQNNDTTLLITNKIIGTFWHGMLFVATVGKCAIVSTARLSNYGDIAVEACHEIGHTLGLRHCSNDCLMAGSFSAEEVCKKSRSLCSRCSRIIAEDIYLPEQAKK